MSNKSLSLTATKNTEVSTMQNKQTKKTLYQNIKVKPHCSKGLH
jgi:hypothetical protein